MMEIFEDRGNRQGVVHKSYSTHRKENEAPKVDKAQISRKVFLSNVKTL